MTLTPDPCAFALREDLRDLTLRRRLASVWYCLWYGVRPWWMYERVKHHRGSYWDHLTANLAYAWRWVTWRDQTADRAYEAEVNGPW